MIRNTPYTNVSSGAAMKAVRGFTGKSPLLWLMGTILVSRSRNMIADGSDPASYELRPDEGRSFDGDTSVTVRLSEGASANVVVNGTDYGYPGVEGEPWKRTFSYEQPSPPGG